MHELTEEQAGIIANVLTQIRPDWSHASLMTQLWEHRAHPASFGDLVIAAATKAQQGDLRTPAAIWSPGPHWPTASEDAVRSAHHRGPRCTTHPEEVAATCRCCAADRIAEAPEPRTTPCTDHGHAPAGECPTCWQEVQTGTRARRWIGRTPPAVETQT